MNRQINGKELDAKLLEEIRGGAFDEETTEWIRRNSAAIFSRAGSMEDMMKLGGLLLMMNAHDRAHDLAYVKNQLDGIGFNMDDLY